MLPLEIPAHFKARRDALVSAHPGSVLLLAGAPERVRNSDVSFKFRQESSFHYLTGFDEPDAFLVLASSKSVLFLRERDRDAELWDGERYGTERARAAFRFDETYSIDQLDAKLPELLLELLKDAEQVLYRFGADEKADRQVQAALEAHRRDRERSGRGLPPMADPLVPLGEMRLFKAPEEVAALREACRISAAAHEKVMRAARPGMSEGDVEALIEYEFRLGGCQRLAYGTIAAGGANATCLHYVFNNQPLRDGDLLLIDAGGEFDLYAADITRTFPVGPRFSVPQAKLYDLVLRAQLETIALAKPGAKLPDLHRHASLVLIEGLLSLGLLQAGPKAPHARNAEEIFKMGGHRRFYPHGTSHWLGLDVHDVGAYRAGSGAGEPRALEPGMVFTIEPGLYVQPGDQEAAPEYRGIGIRIEDDILVTAQGCEVLTAAAPKERAALEALRGL